MQQNTIMRAFELAESGSYGTVEAIRQQLRTEQHSHVDTHLSGAGIKKQLQAIIRQVEQPT